MACGFLNKFKFSKKLKKLFYHIHYEDQMRMQSPTPNTQMRRQEQSLPVMKERIADLSLPMMKHE